MKKFGILLLILVALLFASGAFAAPVHVTVDGAGTKDGSSWANAMGKREILTFLDDDHVDGNAVEVWFKAGTYKLKDTKTY